MLQLLRVHHIAIICSNYTQSKDFYTRVLGFTLQSEHYREQRKSYKADLALNGTYTIELFSFPSPPPRPSRPEACGLRHLAFEVQDVAETVTALSAMDVIAEPIRIDELTGRQFTFIADPDGLPIEFYQQ